MRPIAALSFAVIARRRGVRRRRDARHRRPRPRRRPRRPQSEPPSASGAGAPRRRRPAISTSSSSRRRSTTRTSTRRRPARRRRRRSWAASSSRSARRTRPPAEQIPFIQDATTQGYKAIVVSATGADEVAPALKAAKDAGIKVVGYDSSPAEGAYDVFVNQTDFSLIGGSMAQWACDLAPDCTGEIAILSATATATNQNAWIADFNKALTTDPKFAKLKLVDTVYGDDDATKSTNVANGLLQTHPNLKVIVAPTTVGILAAAQVVKQAASAVKVTGLGLPNDMKSFVADGTAPEFGLWSVPDLGYLAYYVAAKLISGEIKGTPGETFTVPSLNDGKPYTIGEKSVVILGPPVRVQQGQRQQLRLLGGSPPPSREAPGAPFPGPLAFRRLRCSESGSSCASCPAPRPSTASVTPHVWPEMLAELKAAGAANYSIFLDGDRTCSATSRSTISTRFQRAHGRERGQRPLAGRHGRPDRPAHRSGDRLPPPARRGVPSRMRRGAILT